MCCVLRHLSCESVLLKRMFPAVQVMSLEWAKKLDAKIPGHASEAAANALGSGVKYLMELMTTVLQFLNTLPKHFSKHYATADGLARKHVVPVVQPHYNRMSRQLSTNLAPARLWTEKNVIPQYKQMETTFNCQTAHLSHTQIALLTLLGCAVVYFVLSRLVSWLMHEPEQPASQRRAEFIRSLPVIKGMVTKQREKAVASVKSEIASREVAGVSSLMELPLAGVDAENVMGELEERAANDFRYADGESKTTGTIYMAGDVHRELLNDAYCMFSQANPLHVDLFPSVRRMDAEVVSMTASLLGGGHDGVKEVRHSLAHYMPGFACPLSARLPPAYGMPAVPTLASHTGLWHHDQWWQRKQRFRRFGEPRIHA